MDRYDYIPNSFDYKNYAIENSFLNLLKIDELPKHPERKIIYDKDFSVDQHNKVPYPPEIDDLARLHYITVSRKVTTILEFGVGKSSVILSDALRINKNRDYKFTFNNLRRGNLYECHSIDNYQQWINECKKNIPDDLLDNKYLNLHISNVSTSEFCGRICTYYERLPNISPDLIYLDGPDQYSPVGEIRGLSTRHKDRMPMAADILSFEHFLQPGTLIIIDGRTANARFLKSNFQRNWSHLYVEEWDQHFFELLEKPLGIYNKQMIDFCLGESFYRKLNN